MDLGDGTEFAEEAEFAEDDRAAGSTLGVGEVHGAVEVGGGDGQGDGGVGGGVVEFDAADDVDEDVFVDEAEAGAFFEDGDDHGDARGVGAGDFAFGGAEHGVGGEGLHFDHQDARAREGGGDDGAGGFGAFFVGFEEEGGGVFDGFEAGAGHAEEADFEGGAEAVFGGADDAVVVVGVAFEIEDGIDDVFDELGAGEDAFLGDVADEADGGAGGFGEVDEFSAAVAELGDGTGGGGISRVVDHLDGVDDGERGAEAADGGGDFFEVGFGEDFEGGLAEAEAAGAELGLLGGFFGGDIQKF